jgi:hypothetical protein
MADNRIKTTHEVVVCVMNWNDDGEQMISATIFFADRKAICILADGVSGHASAVLYSRWIFIFAHKAEHRKLRYGNLKV